MIRQRGTERPRVNPTKLFSLQNKDFFCFSLLRLDILKQRKYFLMLQTFKLYNENLKKTKKSMFVRIDF
jgi:hypothetical protein